MKLALIGNQNTGKTMLFNQLTGANQHVGNFPGVTVDMKSGLIKDHPDMIVADLPGIYSLSPYTMEEIVTRDFLLKERPDGIINIVDISNIERNLYLTLQLLELNVPTVLAANMMDELYNNGGSIDIEALSHRLGIPVVPISALKNEGVSDLVKMVRQTVERSRKPLRVDFCEGAVHRCIHGISHLIEDHAERIRVPGRFAATKVIEGDQPILDALALSDNETEMTEHSIVEMERETHTDRQAALADMRYNYITKLCQTAVHKPLESKEQIRSTKIDAVLTHKYLGLPIFLCIMLVIFALSFGVIGRFLSNLLRAGIGMITAGTNNVLEITQINPAVRSLVIDGIYAGVGSVLSFLPIIVTLFFFLSLLEDSGYMARVAFVMDKPLRKLGLSGKSFVPLLIGFGCSVPAIMSTRTISSERDRKLTVMLIPFMSCSAKLPIYAVLSAAFFPKYAALVMLGLYAGGMAIGVFCGLALKSYLFQGNSVPFLMELPNYRVPSAKSVVLLMWEKAKDFLTRAFTVIFVASIMIWFLQTFDARFNIVANPGDSLLAILSGKISLLFAPLGFGDWKAVTALVTGFMAKEAVVSTLAVLSGATPDTLSGALVQLFTPLSALSFLIFTLLYTPCVAAIATVKKELGLPYAAGVVVFQLAVAWIASYSVYQVGLLLIRTFA